MAVIKDDGFISRNGASVTCIDALDAITYYYHIEDMDLCDLLSDLSALDEHTRQVVSEYVGELVYKLYEEEEA